MGTPIKTTSPGAMEAEKHRVRNSEAVSDASLISEWKHNIHQGESWLIIALNHIMTEAQRRRQPAVVMEMKLVSTESHRGSEFDKKWEEKGSSQILKSGWKSGRDKRQSRRRMQGRKCQTCSCFNCFKFNWMVQTEFSAHCVNQSNKHLNLFIPFLTF